MFGKLLGFALTALPGVAGFMVYGLTQKKMGPVASAALAGAAFAATDIGGKLLAGGNLWPHLRAGGCHGSQPRHVFVASSERLTAEQPRLPGPREGRCLLRELLR